MLICHKPKQPINLKVRLSSHESTQYSDICPLRKSRLSERPESYAPKKVGIYATTQREDCDTRSTCKCRKACLNSGFSCSRLVALG